MSRTQEETARIVLDFVSENQGYTKEFLCDGLDITVSQLRHATKYLKPDRRMVVHVFKLRNYHYTGDYYEKHREEILERFDGKAQAGGEEEILIHIGLINSVWPLPGNHKGA